MSSPLETVFVGIGAVVVGTVLGSLLTAWLTKKYQAALLHQQLEFEEKLAAAASVEAERRHKEYLKKLDDAAQIVNGRLRTLGCEISRAATQRKTPSRE